ncbi:MAG: phosphate/phosphonate ABC transporter permease, partial [Bacilli bacterium]|nr:phosphate/phosphonate ABC transporter permease [Bacilli bacterium]
KYFIWPDASDDPEKRVIMKYFLTLQDYGIPFLMYETIMIAFIGTLLGGVLSIPIAFLSSKNITGKVVSNLGVVTITLIRTMPVFIWAMFFVTVKGGAFAGVLAISVTSIGMISKLFIESIEDIDKGILEALDSTGATTLQKIRYGIIPQLTANFLSTVIYRFEINVKNATILGMVGAGGIGFTLIDAIGSFNFPLVAICLWGIIPVVFVIEYFSTRIRTKLTTGE